MNPTWYAVRTGATRGLLEYRIGLTNAQDVSNYVFTAGVLATVLFFQRNTTVDGTSLSLAALAMPGIVGMLVAYSALIGVAYPLATEREDGTLLRAKALPNGIVAYVSGQVVRVSVDTVTGVLVFLVPCLLLIDGVAPRGALGWPLLALMLALGLLATVPLGMVFGSVTKSPRAVGALGMLAIGGITAISGVFYPITALPGWVQAIGQVFPVYWLGLGMRSAFLPDEAVAVEIAGSWRHLETLGMLGIWAVVGLTLAPLVLRRMARRESGSSVEASRLKAMQRV
jgi:ABC-2 type transport system permease protein